MTTATRAKLHKLRITQTLCEELALATRDHADFLPEGAEQDTAWLTANEPYAARMSDIANDLLKSHSDMTAEENSLALELAEKERQERATGLVVWGA